MGRAAKRRKIERRRVRQTLNRQERETAQRRAGVYPFKIGSLALIQYRYDKVSQFATILELLTNERSYRIYRVLVDATELTVGSENLRPIAPTFSAIGRRRRRIAFAGCVSGPRGCNGHLDWTYE